MEMKKIEPISELLHFFKKISTFQADFKNTIFVAQHFPGISLKRGVVTADYHDHLHGYHRRCHAHFR